MPATQAKLLIILAMTAYGTAAMLAWIAHLRKDRRATRSMTLALVAGAALCLAVVVLRLARGHAPAASGFDTFALLALLAGASAVYLRAVDALGRAELALLPLATVWAGLAVGLSGPAYRDFARDTWTVVHVILSASASLAFAAASVGAWLYLRKYRQLRRKDPRMFDSPAPPLESLGRFLRRMLPVAFALVTATLVTGLAGAFRRDTYFHNWATHPKMLTSVIVWVVYSVALHAAYARRFRARLAAMLSIVGFILLLAVLLASMLLPMR